jgi:MFS transporter, MHS family, proline/betaine transporter
MPTQSDRRRALVSSCIANVIEWYDFAIFGAFAAVLATVLLPPTARETALVSVFAVFATSFLARPIGALIAGVRADRRGRRRILVAMLFLMAGATGAIGALPTWSAVGVVAPLSLVILRLLQGFSSGGQITTSITFLTEFAPDKRRGWFGGWHTATVAIGLALGLSAAAVATTALTAAQLVEWGWRIPFLIALPLGLIGVFIRLRLTETPAFGSRIGRPMTSGQLATVWREHRAAVITGFVLVALLSGAFNLWFVFLPAHLAAREAFPLSIALACALVGLIVAAMVAPVVGALSDRVGRRSVLAVAVFTLCVLPVPLYAVVAGGSTIGLLVSDTTIGSALAALVLPAYLSECFPTPVRATGLGLTFGLASALIGGTAPLVAATLDHRGLPHAAPVYLTVLAIAGIFALIKAPTGTREISEIVR